MSILQNWKGMRLEIAEFCRDSQISEDEFVFLGIYEWQNIYDKILDAFVEEQYAGRRFTTSKILDS